MLGVRSVLIVLLLTSFVRADDGTVSRATVETFDGTLQSGQVVGFDGTTLRFVDTDGDSKSWQVDELLDVTLRDESPPVALRDAVLIANGDVLAARAISADEETLVADWTFREGSVEVPLETVRGIAWRLPRGAGRAADVLDTLKRDPDSQGDRIVTETGDTVLGEYRGLGAEGVTLAISGTETTVPIERVGTLAFDPALIDLADPPDRTVLVRLVDGTRLTARRITVNETTAAIETTFGTRIELPREAVARMRFTGGRARDLADREPAEFEHTPWLGTSWSWQRNRAVTGGPLQLAGRTYDRGLGVHARSRLVYDLDPADVSFRSTVGIDDSSGTGGSVVFVVRLDDREAFRSPVVRGGDEPLQIPPIDVRGAKRLELVVDFADRGDVLDRANWCDAILVRAP